MSHVVRELRALMLQAPRLTLAAAESLTCGRVQAAIGSLGGASDFFVGGITAYTLEQKVRHLSVDRAAARSVRSVSAAIAEQMARGACEHFDSDLAVATTGYAEPDVAAGVDTAFAWWALAHRRRKSWVGIRSGRVECPGAGRVDAQTMVAEAAITELVAYLRVFRGRSGL